MWYVMQVRTGKEEKTLLLIHRHTSGRYVGNCFLPKYERKKKFAGRWRVERNILFPGYVFVDTEEMEQFYISLKQVPELTKILGIGEPWTPIAGRDLELLHQLLNEKHVMEMSEGLIVGTEIRIENGPLKGLDAVIKRIDRHKRTGLIELEMFGRKQEIEVGIEILEKRCAVG